MKIINLTGTVGYDITAKKLKAELPTNGEKAKIIVDSAGGSVYEANRLYNLIIDHLNKYPDTLEVEYGALGASASSYFPLAVGTRNIKVRENTTFMAHKAWTFAIGNSDEMKKEADILDGLDKLIAQVYSKINKKSVDENLDLMKNELWLIGGQNIVNAGFASEVILAGDTAEPEAVEKNVVYAKISEAKNILQENNVTEDLNKWVALIEDVQNIPVGDEKNIKEDFANMKLDEYLNSNPEEMTEYKNRLEESKKAGIESDRERFASILTLAGIKIPANVLESAKNGMTKEEFAVKELEARNQIVKNPSDDLGKLTTVDQTPKTPKAEADGKDSYDDFLDSFYGKKENK